MTAFVLGLVVGVMVLTVVGFIALGGFFSRRAGFTAAGIEGTCALVAFLGADDSGWALAVMWIAIIFACFCGLMGFAAGEN